MGIKKGSLQRQLIGEYFSALDKLEQATVRMVQSGVTESSHNKKKQILQEGTVTVEVKFKPKRAK